MAEPFAAAFTLPDLAGQLLPHAFDRQDGAHDLAHLLRVWRNVARIAAIEGGETDILTAATILHDCVWVDKASALRPQASRLAAGRAGQVLADLGWADDRIGRVQHVIEAHSFSAGIAPLTIEAQILQDADRLDAIGLIGVARCFYIAGLRRGALYDPEDPAAKHRLLNDTAFALDHFQTKLLHLADGFQTATGRALAAERHARISGYYQGLLEELG